MTHAAKILADSISPDGVRLTTFEVTMPRIVLAEFNTHRMFSRNSASSRAIPVKTMLKRVREDPYVPSSWGKNQKGMQAGEDLGPAGAAMAKDLWLEARNKAVKSVSQLLTLGVHKQLTNRLLEPWMWHTVIVTATEWSNFYNLRDNEMAHPDIQIPAHLMWQAAESNEPKKVGYSEWHLPLIFPEDIEAVCTLIPDDTLWEETLVKISCARCARVSYLTHDGKRDLQKDLELYDNLLQPGHMSPFEHAARPMTTKERKFYKRTTALLDNGRTINVLPGNLMEVGTKVAVGFNEDARVVEIKDDYFCGNFNGWIQHRKEIPGEDDILAHRKTT